MKVDKIAGNYSSGNIYLNFNINDKNYNVSKPDSLSQDTVNFTGAYDFLLSKAVNTKYISASQISDSFEILFNAIKTSADIPKHLGFKIISDLYDKAGVKGLYRAFGDEVKYPSLVKFADISVGENLILAGPCEQPFLEMFSWGSRKSDFPRDVRLLFMGDNNKSFDFGFNKSGGWNISQYDGTTSTITDFYPDSGTVKKVTIQSTGCPPESEYFNKDGSRPFWKNLIFGGIIPQGF